MKDAGLKKRLDGWKAPDVEREAVVRLLRAAGGFASGRRRMGGWEFFVSQMRFIGKRTYFLKLFLGAGLLWLVNRGGMEEKWFWTVLSVAGTLLCLAHMEELCGVCASGMRELYLTARNSMRKVLLVRGIVFGGFDLILILGCMICLERSFGGSAWRTFLYFSVPYLLTSLGCLAVLNRVTEEEGMVFCVSIGGCIVVGILFLRVMGTRPFDEEALWLWGLMGAAVLIGNLKEGFLLFKNGSVK